MTELVDELLQVRLDPRPDPLRIRTGPPWTRAIPALAAAVVSLAVMAILDTRDLGLVACGAASWAVASSLIRGRLGDSCLRLHLAAGLLALACFRGAGAAGEFAPAAAVLLVADLAARSAARSVRNSVAPMAGSVPWRFRSSYRQCAARYGAVGLGVAVLLVALAPDPVVKVIGVACLPIAMRSFGMHLVSTRTMRNLWFLVAFFHVAALAAFVPPFGAIAAAWVVVVSETLLLVGVGMLIARRTGVKPFPMQTFAVGSAAALMLFALAVPNTGFWPVIVALVCGTGAAVLFWPKRGLS
ncbi:MAG: hypothetical protein ACYTEG_07380 [Planctomycetota bacterium]|jgi:hypothetical protein